MIRSFIAIILILLNFQNAYAFEEAKCIPIVQKICLDESERIIEGYTTKQCWQYKEILRCSSVEENHCSVLENNRGCNEVSGNCLNQSSTGLCSHFEKKFVCGNTSDQTSEIKLIDAQFTVLRDEQDFAQCDPSIKNEFCELVEEKCVEPAATRNISGKDVYKDCWKWDRKYQCRTNTKLDECKGLQAKWCTELSSQCIHEEMGRCEHYLVKFSCNEKQTNKVNCISNKFCIGEVCDQRVRNVNTGFAKAASYLSAMQGITKDQENCSCNKEKDPNCSESNIDQDQCKIFAGSAKVCRKYTGEFNCCQNRGFLRSIAACNEQEKDLSLKRDAGVCHFVGSWRGRGVLGKFKKKSSYCCFNSKIARIIQEQGRDQLGKNWGEAAFPDCGAFSLSELKNIDFEKIDFSEMYADLKNEVEQKLDNTKSQIEEQLKAYQNKPDELAKVLQGKMKEFYAK